MQREMTVERAIEILDPATTRAALLEISTAEGEGEKLAACDKACRVAVRVMLESLKPKMTGNIYRAALDKWGAEAQTKMVFEEMAELQDALCKHGRGRDSADHIAEEIADVQIMLGQMAVLHGIEAAVDEYREAKLCRLAKKLGFRCEGDGADEVS